MPMVLHRPMCALRDSPDPVDTCTWWGYPPVQVGGYPGRVGGPTIENLGYEFNTADFNDHLAATSGSLLADRVL